MYIIIGGGGQVGYYLAKGLLEQGHEVLVLEKDPRRYKQLVEQLGTSNVGRGDACEARVLADFGSARADIVIAVTGDDEDNLVICQMAKRKFNVRRVIARINNPKNEETFQMLGIDETVSSTKLIYSIIEQEVEIADVIPLTALRRGNLEVVELALPPGAAAVNKKVRDLALPRGVTLGFLVRGETAEVIHGDTVLRQGDSIVAITPSTHVQGFRESLLGRSVPAS